MSVDLWTKSHEVWNQNANDVLYLKDSNNEDHEYYFKN